MNTLRLTTYLTFILLTLVSLIYTPLVQAEPEAKKKPAIEKVVKAKHIGFMSCKGKGLYYSKVKGVKGCYTCPKNMKRTSPTRKMDHPKSCVNRKGKNTYAKANFKGQVVGKCKENQYRYNNQCFTCPQGAKFSFGKQACVFFEPTPFKKSQVYTCLGKGLYRSVNVGGAKGCYVCPTGMKRTLNIRKMNHPKACVNRKGKNTYAYGILLALSDKEVCEKGKKQCKAIYKPVKGKQAAAWYKANRIN